MSGIRVHRLSPTFSRTPQGKYSRDRSTGLVEDFRVEVYGSVSVFVSQVIRVQVVPSRPDYKFGNLTTEGFGHQNR